MQPPFVRSASRCAVFLSIVLLLGLSACATGYHPSRTSADVTADEDEFTEKEPSVSAVTFGPGDEVQIAVWRNPDMDGKYTLDGEGQVQLPLVGELPVGGLTPSELRTAIVEGLSEFFVDPQVRIEVNVMRSQKVYVLGEVRRPGIFYLSADTTNLVEAIAQGGGFTEDAKPSNVLLVRGGWSEENVRSYDLGDLLSKGDKSQNPPLEKGDIVYVPSSTIHKIDRFFAHLNMMVSPLFTLERAIVLEPLVEEVLEGNEDQVKVIVQ